MDWEIIFGVVTVVMVIACVISYKMGRKMRRKHVTARQFPRVVKVSKKTEQTVYLRYKGKDYLFENEKMLAWLHVGDEVAVVVHQTYWKGQKRYRYLTVEDPEFK